MKKKGEIIDKSIISIINIICFSISLISINTTLSVVKSEISTKPSLTSEFNNVFSNKMIKIYLIFSPHYKFKIIYD